MGEYCQAAELTRYLTILKELNTPKRRRHRFVRGCRINISLWILPFLGHHRSLTAGGDTKDVHVYCYPKGLGSVSGNSFDGYRRSLGGGG